MLLKGTLYLDGKAVSKCLFYMEYHVNIMQCMQPNFILTGQVYPMLCRVCPMPGAHSTEKVPFIDCIFFLKGVVFMV